MRVYVKHYKRTATKKALKRIRNRQDYSKRRLKATKMILDRARHKGIVDALEFAMSVIRRLERELDQMEQRP